MADLFALPDEARLVLENLKDTVRNGRTPTIRLGVTGLSRSGKTVFITALIHNLTQGGRLPLFRAYSDGRLISARLRAQPDDTVPRFEYEKHVEDLIGARVWPRSTSRISQTRVCIEFESAHGWRRTLGRGRLNLDIVDYPGEWLLDLSLLGKSFRSWSKEACSASQQPVRRALASPWYEVINRIDPLAPADESLARETAAGFADYLKAARNNRLALSMLPPGRFLMPGDLQGSPALTFSPLKIESEDPFPNGSLGAMMERRFKSYQSQVVKPFFQDHFARLDRQIVLVDPLAALNAGAHAVQDLERALGDILACFRPGRRSWLGRIVSPRIDRVLLAATKADHVHRSDHDRLARLLAHLTRRAAERAQISGAKARVIPLAAVRATREAEVTKGSEVFSALLGTPLPGEAIDDTVYDGETEIALFPGEFPDDPARLLGGTFQAEDHEGGLADLQLPRFLRFRPPQLERSETGTGLSLPHIRLDQALEYLIGDKLI